MGYLNLDSSGGGTTLVGKDKDDLRTTELLWKKTLFGLTSDEMNELCDLIIAHCDSLDPKQYNISLIKDFNLRGLANKYPRRN